MKKCFRRLTAAVLFAAAAGAPALGQATNFTYQGKLELSGTALNDDADFQFRLFDSSSGGSQVGGTQTVNGLSVVNGLFQTSVDFGAGAFNGGTRYLEIATRAPAGTGNFVILTPRQRFTPAPYAMFADNAATAALATRPWVINGSALGYTAGRVGIGTTSPASLLEVNGAQDAVRVRGDAPIITLTDTNNSKRTQLQNSGGRFFVTSEDFIAGVNGAAFTTWMADGKMGIGTFNPTSRVEIAAQDGLAITGFQPFMTLRDTGATGSPRALVSSGNGDMGLWSNGSIGRGVPSVIIKDNDWVGMGVPNPAFRLDLPNISSPDGRGRANSWSTYSSARWKEHVQPIDGALDKVMHMRGVTFDWKPEYGGTHDVGFIAEEVGHIVPELVTWEKDGVNAQGLAYDRISALTVEAIKDQQKQIQTLSETNAALQARIEKLEAALSSK